MNQEQLDALRHSTAHLLAAAVLKLYPDTKRAIGPAIPEGFYYDFEFSKPISEEDLKKIEKEMEKIAQSWKNFEKKEITPAEAKKFFAKEPYKLELIDEFSKQGQKLTLYTSGDYTDLCKGGHTEQPSKELRHFKLLKIAGAYWRGNEKNKMLTRIYGTAFPTKEELTNYLTQLEEAAKRDHRKLGKELDLFVFSELVGGGLPLWTPKGTILRQELDNFVWEMRQARGYQRVAIPHITKRDLYETSGHWQKFSEELFRIKTREGHEFAMKPMNCPHHTQIFARFPRSYREMPQRYAETTMVYRDEQSGELSGLSRVRCITQDDAHVFCRKTQIKEEFFKIWDIINKFYTTLGFELKIRLSFHDPESFEKYLGTREIWKEAETAIENLAKDRKVKYFIAPGEAAMYGPKVDFLSRDSLGREWQVATIQLDMNLPERFDLFCINEKGEKERIVMIHAAIMGSIERFTSVYIEHTAGRFPLWLSPVQVKIVTVTDRSNDYAQEIGKMLTENGIRVEYDMDADTISKKVRTAELQKIPLILTIGDKEVETRTLAIRHNGKNIFNYKIEAFLTKIKEDIKQRKQELEF